MVFTATNFVPTAAVDSSGNNQIYPSGGTVDVSDNTAVTLTFGGISYVAVTGWSDTVLNTTDLTVVNLTCEVDSVANRGENLTFYYNVSGTWVYACGGAIAGAGNYSCDLFAKGVNTAEKLNNMDVKCQVEDTNGGQAASLTLDAIKLFVNMTVPAGNVTGTGTTSFTIVSNIILNLNDSTVSLGSLTINQNRSSEDVNDWFNIINEGTIAFNLYAYGATIFNSPFLTSTNNANRIPNNYYLIHANTSLSGTANTTYRPVPATIANKTLLVQSLNYVDGLDSAKIGILVLVPSDEPAGAKSATVTLYAESG
ncbi:hypothetical protein HYU06_07215 [Candidatus Woesearchaeota archaeon]|nr:hypothetical protein [Candidatus Woesearchaeota archaeon]